MKKIKVGIVGGAGYTGGELIRLLLNHSHVEIVFVHSKSKSHQFIYETHTDLIGDTDLKFSDTISQNIDVLFLCVAHGEAKKWLDENKLNDTIKIIDLSADFRMKDIALKTVSLFVYGLPELNRDAIKAAQFVANPGCFATCIQLALLPLAKGKLLKNEIHISATTGSTGAGQALSTTSHFSWRNNNLSFYKPFEHQHLNEINQSILQLQNEFASTIHFIPQRGSFARGIFASCYLDCDISIEEAIALYEDFYADHPFVVISKQNIDLKQVVNTNKCLLYLEKHGNKLLIASAIDNLLKGASGQAVQNMNLLFGLAETTGLKLKATAF
ncbi:MAG: N-acetyl-gamma-glutamyl-phosphate reductase [Bacteroidota bacterium]